MKIWIVNYYAGTPETAGNPRYLKLAKHFVDAGHEVLTFNASRIAHISDNGSILPFSRGVMSKEFFSGSFSF